MKTTDNGRNDTITPSEIIFNMRQTNFSLPPNSHDNTNPTKVEVILRDTDVSLEITIA